MDQSLTVVLPMHNCERTLRSSVLEILDLASLMARSLDVVVVDDGSTDDTYELACEMARLYPQLSVMRQSMRQGVRAALEMVRNRLQVERVVVHDGISPIEVSQLQRLMQEEKAPRSTSITNETSRASEMESCGSRRFAAVRALHDSMEQAHRSTASFRWVLLEKPLIPRRCQPSSPALAVPALANLPTSMNTLPLG